MRHRHTHFLLPCLLFAACVTAQAQQGGATGQPAPEFQVLEVRGTTNIMKPGLQEASLSTKGFVVAAHDEIRTGPDGYVRIGLKDGSQVEILGNSRIQLGLPRPSLMRMLDIFLGHVRVVIEHISGKPNPYSFGTPTFSPSNTHTFSTAEPAAFTITSGRGEMRAARVCSTSLAPRDTTRSASASAALSSMRRSRRKRTIVCRGVSSDRRKLKWRNSSSCGNGRTA